MIRRNPNKILLIAAPAPTPPSPVLDFAAALARHLDGGS